MRKMRWVSQGRHGGLRRTDSAGRSATLRRTFGAGRSGDRRGHLGDGLSGGGLRNRGETARGRVNRVESLRIGDYADLRYQLARADRRSDAAPGREDRGYTEGALIVR